jgi:hypothetical protein
MYFAHAPTASLPRERSALHHAVLSRFNSVYTTVLASTDELLAEFKMLASLGLLSTLEEVLESGARNIQKDVLRAIRLSLSNDSKRGSFARDTFLRLYSRRDIAVRYLKKSLRNA